LKLTRVRICGKGDRLPACLLHSARGMCPVVHFAEVTNHAARQYICVHPAHLRLKNRNSKYLWYKVPTPSTINLRRKISRRAAEPQSQMGDSFLKISAPLRLCARNSSSSDLGGAWLQQ
jgi:hypothetical protein